VSLATFQTPKRKLKVQGSTMCEPPPQKRGLDPGTCNCSDCLPDVDLPGCKMS